MEWNGWHDALTPFPLKISADSQGTIQYDSLGTLDVHWRVGCVCGAEGDAGIPSIEWGTARSVGEGPCEIVPEVRE